MAAGGLKAFAQVRIIVDPFLQLAVGCLRIESGEIELGQLGAAVSAYGECFHRIRVVFTDVKLLKISGNTMRKRSNNQQQSTIINFYQPLPTVTDFPRGGGVIFVSFTTEGTEIFTTDYTD